MEIVSRIGKIKAQQDKIYNLISDFSNLGDYIPKDKVKDFVSDADSCSFSIDKIGKFGMKIIDKEPSKTIKIANNDDVNFKFNMWIQLKEVNELDTRVRITLKADLNPMMKMMAKKPLNNFINTLIDKLETII
jgi:carbon monoxide dehydrogenase subunit G